MVQVFGMNHTWKESEILGKQWIKYWIENNKDDFIIQSI